MNKSKTEYGSTYVKLQTETSLLFTATVTNTIHFQLTEFFFLSYPLRISLEEIMTTEDPKDAFSINSLKPHGANGKSCSIIR